MCGGCAELIKKLPHLTTENQIRCAVLSRCNFDILPTDSATPASLQRFQCRFFCGETRGIMLCRHRAATVAVVALSLREHSLGKTRRAQEHFANSRDFDNVYADGKNHD